MKRVITASTNFEKDAKDLLFNMLYEFCKDNAGISTSFMKPLTRNAYYQEFDMRFESDVNQIVIRLLGRDFDLGQGEIDIIVNALLEKAKKDTYFAYKKPDYYDELIEEWGLPIR